MKQNKASGWKETIISVLGLKLITRDADVVFEVLLGAVQVLDTVVWNFSIVVTIYALKIYNLQKNDKLRLSGLNFISDVGTTKVIHTPYRTFIHRIGKVYLLLCSIRLLYTYLLNGKSALDAIFCHVHISGTSVMVPVY